MDLDKAETIARNLMAKHGLTALGWKFKFDRATSRNGLCTYNTKTISISHHMARAGTSENVIQVMLHEIAHASLPIWTLAPNGYSRVNVGHGPLWKAHAKSIGYTGGRTIRNPYNASGKPQEALSASRNVIVEKLPEETPVRLSNGVTGVIIKINRVNYRVRSADGNTWKVPFSLATRIGPTPVSVQTLTATVTKLNREDFVETVLPAGRNSKYAGLFGTIKNVTEKNYIIELTTGGKLTVPHSMAVKA